MKHYLKKIKYLFASFYLLSVPIANAQKNVNVDLSTGTANVTIPVYELNRSGITIPISLSYSTIGLKVKEEENTVGINWQLNAGGSISRDVKDLPDDIKRNNKDLALYGWLYNSNGVNINSFSIQNDNNLSTCDDETSDVNTINSLFNNSDKQPDIFSVNAPGLSFQFIFDNAKNIRTISNEDVIITYTTTPDIYSTISSFSVVNSSGLRYEFSLTESSQRKADSPSASSIKYFRNDYEQYKDGVTFSTKWLLTKITNPNGNYVDFSYNNGEILTGVNSLKLKNGTASFATHEYTIRTKYNPKLLSKISVYNNRDRELDFVKFDYNSLGLLTRILAASGETWQCNYNTAKPLSKSDGKTRNFLTSFGNVTYCGGDLPYYFEYSGLDQTQNTIDFPDVASKAVDLWGYYNGSSDTTLIPKIFIYPSNHSSERYRLNAIPNYSGVYYELPGANRSVNSQYVSKGALTKIIYPEGGSTRIEYESNEYYDNTANVVFKGAGIRISRLRVDDGSNSATPQTTTFSYIDPLTGITSGRIIGMPIMAFTIPYSGSGTLENLWNLSTIRSQVNLSSESDYVIYGKVRSSQAGAGSTAYEFSTPATFWDRSATGNWSPTIVNAARLSCTSSMGYLSNSSNTYPFPPNPNYDFERRLLMKQTLYKDNGTKVSEDVYTYQRSDVEPLKVTGLVADLSGGASRYSKYTLLSAIRNLTSQKTQTIFDLNDQSKQLQKTENYYYQSSAHKLLTQQKTSSNGLIERVFTKYAKDYSLTAVNDENSIALKGLVSQNINAPIEVYTTIEKDGIQKAISGKLTKYKSYDTEVPARPKLYLPSQDLAFINAAGISNFQPSSVTSGRFIHNAEYTAALDYLSYDKSGNLLTTQDNYKNLKSVQIDNDFIWPIARFDNANYDEVMYVNFDGSENESGVVVDGGFLLTSEGRNNGRCLSMNNTSSIKKPVKKNALVKKYIFSCWIKTSESGKLSLNLTNTANQSASGEFSFVAGTDWKYYELKILAANISSDFVLRVLTNSSIKIDDVLFYPEQAEVMTYEYEPKFYNKISETNSNGVSTYYDYDQIGRLQFVYNQDKDIVQKISHVKPNAVANGLYVPVFSTGIGILYATQPLTFNSISNVCIPGVTYNWNFGDGTTATSMNGHTQSHTYASPGSYNVTLTVVHSSYETKTYTKNITVIAPPLLVNICQSGVIEYNYCDRSAITTTCNSYPSDNSNAYFSIYSVNGPVFGTLSYSWQQSFDNGNTWTTVGTNTNQFVKNMTSRTLKFVVRCVVTSSSGQTGTSNFGYVSVKQCGDI